MALAALLDSNVWVSAFLKPTGPPGHVIDGWQRGEFSVVTCFFQLNEISQVLARPRLRKKFSYSTTDAKSYVRLIAARSIIVETASTVKICRDPDDDVILEAAINGEVQYLVTRDDDLKRDLDLITFARRNGVRVMSVRQFLRRLSRASTP